MPGYYSSDNSAGMVIDPTVRGGQNGHNQTLTQAESTQFLMPQKQMQGGNAHAQMTGSQMGMPAMMTHGVGMNMPQNMGNGQNPDAISLPITVGPPVPLYSQSNLGMSGQGAMLQNGTERRCIENTPGITPIVAQPNGSGTLMEFSPVCAQSTLVRSSPPLIIPLTSNTEKLPQPSMSVDVNATLMGLNAQQLTQWFNSLNSTQSSASGKEEDYMNRVRLNMEAQELVEGTMGVNRLESYTEEELRYLCPRITKEVNKVHKSLQEAADRNGVDIDKMKHLSRSYRLDFGTTDFEHMRSAGMKAHLRELLQSVQVWRCLDKWESRWVKRKEKRRDSATEHNEKRPQSSETVTMLPMRETAGGKLIHVPWHRSDIQSFTDDFPKLREKPIEWYQQTDRFVKLAKCLWEDLNTLFEIVVPADLWEDCKRAVGWPTSEPERDRETGAPSPMVMSLYYKVIEHLKTKVAAKNVDWQKIDRTAQEAKELIHSYYERLLKAFKNYSGTETIEAKDMLHFVFRFVEGLRPEISQMIKSHLICWQSKPIDEVLNYAKYCSDEIEVKQKRLKEKVMMMQLKAAQTGLQGLQGMQGFQQQVPQQQPQLQGNMAFQPQARGRGRGGFVNNGPDLNTVVTGVQAMKKVMPCHVCGIVGHWKRECPMVVQEGAGAGVGQQNNDVNAFQAMRGPKMRGPSPNFQTVNQLQGLQPMQPQQMQMPRMQMTQMQPMQQQLPMVPNQQMQIPLAPMSQQQVMVPPQVSGQVMSTNGTVQQFPLHSESGINNVWESESSEEEGDCVLAASLEVDQRGPYVEGRVMGHRVSFLVDTGATRSTVKSSEVPNLPLSGRTVQVVGVANRHLTNPITDPVPVSIGNYQGVHQFVVCDSSPIALLGRDLLCKLGCSIMCSNEGITIQTSSDGEEEDSVEGDEMETVDEEYPLICLFPMITEEDIPAELRETVGKEVWDMTGKEVGLMKGVEPVKVTVKPNAIFPQTPQYHMAQDTLMKVAQLIDKFVKQGVLKEVLSSPCNSPIMGLIKPSGKVRLVQDLRKINDIIVKCCPVVPNPAVIMFQIPCDAEWFSVIDLSQAFFSVPLHEDSQFLFCFKFLDRVYSWCRIPQGFSESPSIFNQILKKDLEALELPFESTLVQYIDDLLVASKTESGCTADTIALLNHLGRNGHKVSPSKLQFCQKKVKYLGHQIEKGSRRIMKERITSVLQMSPPKTRREVRKFLGMVGYCRQWIPNFSTLAKPLLKLTQKDALDKIELKGDEMDAFVELKECMCRAPALGMPDYTKPFTLFCHERDACSLSVLTQAHGGVNRPVAYFSATLDPVAAALPGCLRAVAAVGISLTQSEGIVMGHPVTVMVPHSVEILLTRSRTQHMTGARLTRYETIILGSPNVQLKRCTTLNPATLLPGENAEIENAEDVEHDCLQVTEFCTKPRPDIKDTKLDENDQILFVDGSCLRDGMGILKAGYAVCTVTGVLEAGWLQGVYSAQVAELVALTRACQLSALMKVTIYTDSQYGFGIVHDFGQLWSQRGFLTSSGSPVKNGERIRELLHAIQVPAEVAVVKCSAHTKGQDYVSLGNAYADQVARFCALNCILLRDEWNSISEPELEPAEAFALKVVDTIDELKALQNNVKEDERDSWIQSQCIKRPDELWVSHEGKFVLPNSLLSQLARFYHGQAHLGRDAMIRLFKTDWFNPRFRQAAEAVCHRCVTCQQMNPGKGTVVNASHIGRASGPFSRMQMDFIEMPVHGGLRYVLVIVCIFSHWIEAYPTRRNDSLTVAKLLLRELIPRFGFPISLESDRGSHFNNEVIKLLCEALNIEQKLHCSYRPEASGLVEQMNGTLKSRMAKICASTNLKWPDALPLVLMSMRNTPDRKTGLSPHEILMGRAMRLPAVPANALLNITDDMVLDYCKGLADVVRSLSHQVEATTLPPIQGPGHALKAGDWVVVKKHVRKSCLEPRWKGPFQVILTTTTAVKCAGVPNWIHASHTKKVLCPTDEEVEALKLPVPDKTVLSAETEQNRTESERAEAGEREILLEGEESDSLGEDQGESSDRDGAAEGDKEPEAAEGSKKPEAAEGDKEPEAAESDKEPEESNGDEGLEKGEKAGEPDERRAFPEADDTGKEKENVIDSPEEGDKAEQNEKVQASSEKIAGPSNGHGPKRRLSISPIKQRTEESLNEGGRPKVKEKRKEVIVGASSPNEEKDLTKEESTSEAESKREAKLKRKRIPNRRYSGPEWAYAVNDDWTDEFVSLSIENEEEEEIPIEKKSFMDSVD
ncbi:hypothetical protein NDU88_003162 [Pleurodeles waltl]|uniref:Gag-Pol polyprotein n=1 Tax=Pleurodeles waltl TaxID=8319 RepID=A0AAV7TMN8_PLEWA|nr:hypothetical protein NDU88_003162 [Pleurodeles waltl]